MILNLATLAVALLGSSCRANLIGSACCGEENGCPHWDKLRIVKSLATYATEDFDRDRGDCELCHREIFVPRKSEIHLQCLPCGPSHLAMGPLRYWEFKSGGVATVLTSTTGTDLRVAQADFAHSGAYTCNGGQGAARAHLVVCERLPKPVLTCTSFLIPDASDIIADHGNVETLSMYKDDAQRWCKFEYKNASVRIFANDIIDRYLRLEGTNSDCFPNCTTKMMCRGREHDGCHEIMSWELNHTFRAIAELRSAAEPAWKIVMPIMVDLKSNYEPRIRPTMVASSARTVTFQWPAPDHSDFYQPCRVTVMSHRIHGTVTQHKGATPTTMNLTGSLRKYEKNRRHFNDCRAEFVVDGLVPHQFYTITLSYGINNSPYMSQSFEYFFHTPGVAPSAVQPAFVPGGYLRLRSRKCRVFWSDVAEWEEAGEGFRSSLAHSEQRQSGDFGEETAVVAVNASVSSADMDCSRSGRLSLSCANRHGVCGGRDFLVLGKTKDLPTPALALFIKTGDTPLGRPGKIVQVRWSPKLSELGPSAKWASVVWCHAASWEACRSGVKSKLVSWAPGATRIVVSSDCELVVGVAACTKADGCGMLVEAHLSNFVRNNNYPKLTRLSFVKTAEDDLLMVNLEIPPIKYWPEILAGVNITVSDKADSFRPPEIVYLSRADLEDISSGLKRNITTALPINTLWSGKLRVSAKAVYGPSMKVSEPVTQEHIDLNRISLYSQTTNIVLWTCVVLLLLSLAIFVGFISAYKCNYEFRRRCLEFYWGWRITVPRLEWDSDVSAWTREDGEPFPIGAGAFGSVSRGKLTSPALDVALKSVPLSPGYDKARLHRRFYAELQALSALSAARPRLRPCTAAHAEEQSPYVVTCHGFCVKAPEHPGDARDYIIVLNYASGGNLKDFLLDSFADNAGNLNKRELAMVALHMSRALAFLKRRGYFHMDIKPDNFVVEVEDVKGRGIQIRRVMLCDFGLSRKCSSKKCQNYTCRCDKGYDKFRAPELFFNSRSHISHAIDIWALGLSIWEVFTYCTQDSMPCFDDQDEGSRVILAWQAEAATLKTKTPLEKTTMWAEGTPPQLAKVPELYRIIRNTWLLDPEVRLTALKLESQLNAYYEKLGSSDGEPIYKFEDSDLGSFDAEDDFLMSRKPDQASDWRGTYEPTPEVTAILERSRGPPLLPGAYTRQQTTRRVPPSPLLPPPPYSAGPSATASPYADRGLPRS